MAMQELDAKPISGSEGWLASADAGGAMEQSKGLGDLSADTGFLYDDNLSPVVAHRPSWFSRIFSRFVTIRGSFLAIVFLPGMLGTLYFVLLASDQYLSETRFAVRTAATAGVFDSAKDSKNAKTSIPTSPSGIPSLAGQDAYVIASYIRDGAILGDFPATLDVRAVFSRPEADFFAKLRPGAPREALIDYWRSMITVYVDGPSGIVTVRVRAFRREDAKAIAVSIVETSEALANRLNARMKADAVRDAQEEVNRSQAQILVALDHERALRDSEGLVDPAQASGSAAALLLGTMTEELKLRSQYEAGVAGMSATAPTVVTLKARLDTLDAQIRDLKSQLAGDASNTGTLSAVISKFDQVEVEKAFAEKLYTAARGALERARLKSEQQSLYLAEFAPPALAEEAEYPERYGLVALLWISLLAVWGILAMTTATVIDHTV